MMQVWAAEHLQPQIISVGHGGWVAWKCPRHLAYLGASDALWEECALAYPHVFGIAERGGGE